jgi:hypothetical protein
MHHSNPNLATSHTDNANNDQTHARKRISTIVSLGSHRGLKERCDDRHTGCTTVHGTGTGVSGTRKAEPSGLMTGVMAVQIKKRRSDVVVAGSTTGSRTRYTAIAHHRCFSVSDCFGRFGGAAECAAILEFSPGSVSQEEVYGMPCLTWALREWGSDRCVAGCVVTVYMFFVCDRRVSVSHIFYFSVPLWPLSGLNVTQRGHHGQPCRGAVSAPTASVSTFCGTQGPAGPSGSIRLQATARATTTTVGGCVS